MDLIAEVDVAQLRFLFLDAHYFLDGVADVEVVCVDSEFARVDQRKV